MKTVKPGIRQKPNGKYLATKSIDGKRHYHEFDSLREAVNWKNKFHPLASPVVNQALHVTSTAPIQSNGRDNQISFKEVVEKYKAGKLKQGKVNTQYRKLNFIESFLPPLFSVRMCEMKPEIITRLLEDAKLVANDKHGRCSFDYELKFLRAIFNWYKDEIDFTFNSPVTKYHKAVGRIKEVQRKRKYLNESQLTQFIDALPEPFQSMAVIQFCHALRIGEVAGLNTDTVDLVNGTIEIVDMISWLKNKPTHVKNDTKTGDQSCVKTNSEVIRRLKKLNELRPKRCKFFFHHKEGPMRYDVILEAYNKALSDAGLHNFSGTHLLRHTMGTMARRNSGIDAAQAILRHTTSRMAEHYAKLDVNEKASQVVIEAEEIFKRGRATIATNSLETLEGSGS